MNLLSIQDALKNASDQQLVQLMRAPDSTTPSYLVVSELNRRKQMRMKQAEPPSGTVAEDLTSEENMQAPMGIRSLQTPEPGDEEYRPEDEAGIEAMREGGIVRMQAGGPPPSGERLPMFRSFSPPPMAEADNSSLMSTAEQELQRLYRSDPSARRNQALIDQTASTYGVSADALRERLGIAAPVTPPPATTPAAPPTAAATTTPATTEGRPTPTSAQTLPLPPEPPRGGPPASGVRTLTPSAAPAAATPDGLPTLQQNMERNLGMFPGIPQELMDRIRDSRTNEGDRRREAQNMALLEAGLRIAGSNNPNFLGAIGEGATPAAQTYAQQLGQIRQDRRADIQTDLAVAQADLQRRYMAGQISAAELQRQTQMLMSREERAARLEAARISAGSSANANEMANRRLDLTERNALAARQHTARMNAVRDVNKEVGDVMSDPMRREAIRSSLRQPGQPAPTDNQIMAALRRDAMNRIFPSYDLEIPAQISDTARPGATVQSGVPR